MSLNKFEHICFFDFEASTDTTPHKAYSVSFCIDNEPIHSLWGNKCAKHFLKSLPDNSLCIAHNASYDISFILDLLSTIYQNPIIKNHIAAFSSHESARILNISAEVKREFCNFVQNFDL